MAKRKSRKTLQPSAPVLANVPIGAHIARDPNGVSRSPSTTLGGAAARDVAGASTVASASALAAARLPAELFPADRLLRIGDERLVAVDGVHGVFTPLATADAADANSSKNLGEIVALLKREVVALREQNLDLQRRLDEQQAKSSRTPDDFASAVKHSLDSLQARLAESSNPVSNFVVREFSLEAKVQVDVSPLGVIDYRFVQPGEAVDPNRLSKLALTIVPTPKPNAAHSFTAPEFTPQVAVEEIQGVGEVWGKRLNTHGLYTVGDLLAAGSRVRSQAELAALLTVDRERLADWLAQAELLTVRDVDGRRAELLARTGVAGLEGLAKEAPETLVEKFNAENSRKREGRVAPLKLEDAKLWIDTAKAWTGRGSATESAKPS
jgi:predicted flap endonuclease-1-like 5' DNA nuclease